MQMQYNSATCKALTIAVSWFRGRYLALLFYEIIFRRGFKCASSLH